MCDFITEEKSLPVYTQENNREVFLWHNESPKRLCREGSVRGLRLLREGMPHGCHFRLQGALYAQVDTEKCVGSGKCARECPASVITMKEAAQ